MEKKEYTTEELKKLVEEGDNRYLMQLGHHLREDGEFLEAYKAYLKVVQLGNNMGNRFICTMCNENELDGFLSKEEQFNWLLRYYEVEGVNYYTSVLARWYKDGIGIKKNLDKYIYHLTQCAEDGSSACTIELAECYENGFGVEQSYEKAFELYDNYVDEHGKPDNTCLYKSAYYRYHELGGAKRNLEVIKRMLLRAGRFSGAAKRLYEEIFNEEFPKI